MRRLIVVAAVALAAVPSNAQFVPEMLLTPASDWRDVRLEPDVEDGGSIGAPTWRGGTGYPADANGVASAKAGTPTLVLDSLIMSSCGVLQDCGVPSLFASFTDRAWMIGGPNNYYRWRALHGTWADSNGDGYVQDQELEGRTPAEIAADPSLSRVYLNPTVDRAADSADEFAGLAGRVIVAYFEPGNWSGSNGPHEPDFTFVDRGGGFYLSNELLLGTPFPTDYGLLRSTVMEVISDPVVVSGGPRNLEAGSGSLVDVDVYRAVDATLEDLYLTHYGEGVGRYTGPLVRLALDTVAAGPDGARWVYGPASARIFPVEEDENGQRGDYESGPHSWFNAFVGFPRWYYGTLTSNNHFHAQSGTAREYHLSLDGTYRPFLYMSVGARFGLWHDLNGDGWIGAPRPTYPGCPDVYACGSVSDPNEIDASANPEFRRLCVSDGAVQPTILVDLTPLTPGASWGAGVYVVRDEDPGSENRNPYDDAAVDLLDLDVDRFVTTGAITVHVNCERNRSEGRHVSDELLVLPGAMIGFDLEMRTRPATVSYSEYGVLLPETIEDVDVVRGFAT